MDGYFFSAVAGFGDVALVIDATLERVVKLSHVSIKVSHARGKIYL